MMQLNSGSRSLLQQALVSDLILSSKNTGISMRSAKNLSRYFPRLIHLMSVCIIKCPSSTDIIKKDFRQFIHEMAEVQNLPTQGL